MLGQKWEQSVCHVTVWKAGNALKHEWGFSMLQMSKSAVRLLCRKLRKSYRLWTKRRLLLRGKKIR